MSRYSRHISLKEIGVAGQEKINKAKVLVVGAGGLGCPVLQYLTAAGIGTIGIVDFDVVEESNLQRQVLFGMTSLGRNKAIVAKELLSNLNPRIELISCAEKLNPENVVSLFKPYDIIVDATDNFTSRYLINDASVVLNKPLVYGAIYKFEGQVSVFNYKGGPSYRCVFPNPPQKGTIPNCAQIGVLGVLPGIIGCMQANEVLKLVLGLGNILSGKLYCFNALNNLSQTLRVQRNALEIETVKSRGLKFEVLEDSFFCTTESSEIELTDLTNENVLFIDVRELHEHPRISLNNLLEIPLGNLAEQIDAIPRDTTLVAFCKSGVRSKQAVLLLKEQQMSNCYSLIGGAEAFSKADVQSLKSTRKHNINTELKTT